MNHLVILAPNWLGYAVMALLMVKRGAREDMSEFPTKGVMLQGGEKSVHFCKRTAVQVL